MIIALQTLIFFRQSILKVFERLLRPYYRKLTFTFSRQTDTEDEDDDEVFAEFDDEKGVVFYPRMYAQRYAAVSDCLLDERWHGKLEKVVDLGYHDMSFIKYLKEVPGVSCILGVDIESLPLRCSSDLLGCEEYSPKRENPLHVTLFQGNAADPDYRLIGCDAVVAIEMIEHMLPHDLDRLVHTVFGFIKPWIAIFTTPNSDFNALFKCLEKNGLRRWDHFFEWTREQFHDWCSNIVARYPQFTVTCKGVGPGPPGTIQYGCCSQLALFINKDYEKQQDLNINSLAIVTSLPSVQNLDYMTDGWDSPITNANMICPKDESLTRLEEILYSAKQSCMTVVISPSFAMEALEYSDKTSQCNLDMEFKRNFLMFNDEDMCFTVLVPRRRLELRVYEIEDVACRLNCSTYQVKKFSKITQGLMAKNQVDSLVHTREVVDEIRHLTNMLNFDKDDSVVSKNGYIWYNINWGDNAPYWNQYFKIVREYSYPFEAKSEESRIIDLISEEVNRQIDIQYDEEYAGEVNKLEIPIEHLMKVVDHITTDFQRVKELLEWNGYEVVDDIVVHSRLVVDSRSEPSTNDDEWPEHDTTSDCDTSELISSTVSDGGSTIVPDYHGRAIRRALDRKVRKLMSMQTSDKEITTELDRVVCRLMKLALRSSRTRQNPPPYRWMQCKMLDLLTLTEKAMARRKRHYIENFPIRALTFSTENKITIASKLHDDHTAMQIVDKYQKLLQLSENIEFSKQKLKQEYRSMIESEGGFFDEELLNFDVNDIPVSPTKFISPLTPKSLPTPERTLQWVENDKLEIVPYRAPQDKPNESLSDRSSIWHKHKKGHGKHSKYHRSSDKNKNHKPTEKPSTKTSSEIKRHKSRREKNVKESTCKPIAKIAQKNSSSNSCFKNVQRKAIADSYTCSFYKAKTKRRHKDTAKLLPTASKPIPGSIIELCNAKTNKTKALTLKNEINTETNNTKAEVNNNVAVTEESLLVDIVMDSEETTALRRTVGTDASTEPIVMDQETVVNVTRNDSPLQTNNVNEQTIFLYDINEPSTSKGIRHVSMDAQCGPDVVTPSLPMITPAASITRLPRIFTTGIKIGDSLTNLTVKKRNLISDFGTSTDHDSKCFGPVSHRVKSGVFSKGIKFKDSTQNLMAIENSEACVDYNENYGSISPIIKSYNVYNKNLKNEDSLANIVAKTSSDSGTCTCEDLNLNLDDNKDTTTTIQRKVCTFGPVSSRIKSSVFSKGIKIKDSFTEMALNTNCEPDKKAKSLKFVTVNPNSDWKTEQCEFGTCMNFNSVENLSIDNVKTNNYLSSTQDKKKPVAINIEGTNTVMNVDCGTGPETFSSIKTSYATKLLTPISNRFTAEDSSSEFYGSCSSQKSTRHTNSSKNISDSQIQSSMSTDIDETSEPFLRKKLTSILSCGGVHVHSFQDKLTSEDIVYQGEWQRYIPKGLSKKRNLNPSLVKKVVDVAMKKKKMTLNNQAQLETQKKLVDAKLDQKKPVQVRTKLTKVKQDSNKIEQVKSMQPVKDFKPKQLRYSKNVAKVSSKSSKLTTSTFSNVRPMKAFPIQPSAQSTPIKKDIDKCLDKVHNKIHVPTYLSRRKKINAKTSNKNLKDTSKTPTLQDKAEKKDDNDDIQKIKDEAITEDLTKFCEEPRDNISYIVYRNDIDVSKSGTNCQANDCAREIPKKKSNNRRSASPVSDTSSVCSTPDSVATVRAMALKSKSSPKKHSASPNKSTVGNNESDNNTPSGRNRKYTKRNKVAKRIDEKNNDNKENIPESSKKTASKDVIAKNVKSPFIGRKSNVFMAHMNNESSSAAAANSVSKHKTPITNKSNIMPAVDSKEEKKRPRSSHYSEDISFPLNISGNVDIQQNLSSTEDLNMNKIIDNRILNQWLDSTNKHTTESAESSILAAMRQIVEERLTFIDNSFANDIACDSEIKIFGDERLLVSSSPLNFRTTTDKENFSDFNLMGTMNRSFGVILGDESLLSLIKTVPPTPELSLLSFKSVTSGKFSEYFLADSEFNTDVQETPRSHSSVRDIFERKDLPMAKNPGVLAIQAFSGFSMNAEPVVGDQPDYVNLVDSETGSLAMDIARQATSEELFVSGRSSGSYESCLIEEDAVVPNWLFNIISQQLSAAEEETQQHMLPMPLPMPMPMPMALGDPMFDLNGNVIEPNVGAGAGAGDGRGMHSDHSQDSSGRGASLSSSETSSTQHSEAILMDPSTFTAQFEMIHEPIPSSIGTTALVLPMDSPDTSYRAINIYDGSGLSTSRNLHRHRLLPTSDVDADVSSLDTDVPDIPSDN